VPDSLDNELGKQDATFYLTKDGIVSFFFPLKNPSLIPGDLATSSTASLFFLFSII
jgi:hypothetical protein